MSYQNFYLNTYFYYIESKLFCVGSLSVLNMVDTFKSTIDCSGLRVFIRYRRLLFYSKSTWSANELYWLDNHRVNISLTNTKNYDVFLLILNPVKMCYFEVTRSLLQVKLEY